MLNLPRPALRTKIRNRIGIDALVEINEMIINTNYEDENNNDDNDDTPSSSTGENDNNDAENKGTLILDAACVPANMKYPIMKLKPMLKACAFTTTSKNKIIV